MGTLAQGFFILALVRDLQRMELIGDVRVCVLHTQCSAEVTQLSVVGRVHESLT